MLPWLLAVVGLLTLIYWYATKNQSYWKSQGVYCLPGSLPWFGHMLDTFLLRKGFAFLQVEVYSDSLVKDQPAVGIYTFRRPALVLRDLDLIQTVLISKFSHFVDNTMTADESIDPYIGKNPFVLKGKRWKTLRHHLTPALSPARIKAMFPSVLRVCQEFTSYLKKHTNEDVNVGTVAGLFTSEVVAKCAFGIDGNAFNDPQAEFYQQGRHMWDSSIYSPLTMLLFLYFPFINKILRRSFIPKEVMAFFYDLVKQVAEYRDKNPDNGTDDYLQFLLNIRSKEPEFTFDDVVAQSLTFFADGFETSSVALSFGVYELVMNPDVQEAVRKEVKSMDAFTYENIASLPLLDRILQEVLRKHSVFTLSKECTEDFVLQASGRTFPVRKGHEIIIPVHGIHHDPKYYPEPEKFDPDRFLPENVKNRHPMTFLSFGTGPRICIGNRFATFQVKVALANLVANFRLVQCAKTESPLTMCNDSFMATPKNGIWIRFQTL